MSVQTRRDGMCPSCNHEHRTPLLKDNQKRTRLRIWRVWQSTSGTSLTLHMLVYIVICSLRVVTCTRAQPATQAPPKTTLAPKNQEDTHDKKWEQRTKTNLQNSPLCFRPKYAYVSCKIAAAFANCKHVSTHANDTCPFFRARTLAPAHFVGFWPSLGICVLSAVLMYYVLMMCCCSEKRRIDSHFFFLLSSPPKSRRAGTRVQTKCPRAQNNNNNKKK